MKKIILLLFLFIGLLTKAQEKITFDYDNAGNQIKRQICLSCKKASADTKVLKEVAELQDEDLEPLATGDLISYYPNPVKEELYLKWELQQNKAVTTIQLFDLNGRLLQNYSNLEKKNNLNIPFYNYPNATYLVIMMYNDGEQKTIKIVK